MRMVQLITVNEVTTKFGTLMMQEIDPQAFEQAVQHVGTAYTFLDQQLGNDPYFGGDTLTLGDIVAVSTLSLSRRLGVSIESYPSLNQWFQRVSEREAWQKTEPSNADFEVWKKWVTLMIKRWQRRTSKKS